MSGVRFEVAVPGGILAGVRDGRGDPLLVRHGGPAADVAKSTGALFRDGQVTMVDGAGHFPWFERPGCVAAALHRIATRLAVAPDAGRR